jgi:hypothetical protein
MLQIATTSQTKDAPAAELRESTNFAVHRNDRSLVINAKPWKLRPNGIGDIARCKVSVMLLGHTRIPVAELCGNDAHGNGAHRQHRGMSMPKNVKRRGRGDLGPSGGVSERPLLMGGSSGLSI